MSELRPLQMSSANLTLNSELENWRLHLPDENARTFCAAVSFEAPFPTTPLVHVSLSGFDVDNVSAARLRVRALDIQPTGFTVEIETWHDTRVYGVDVSWLAIGNV